MRLLGLSALLIFVLDQVSKIAVVHGMDLIRRGYVDVVPGFVSFRMAWNQGVNFGLLSHGSDLVRWALIIVSLIISAWVFWWIRRADEGSLAQLSAGVLIGGALGNVIDRVRYGAVADFLNVTCCGIDNPFAFNVADIAIFAGAAGLVLFAGKGKGGPGGGSAEGRKTA